MTKPTRPQRKPVGKRAATMTAYSDRMMRPARRPKKPRVTKGA